MPTTPGLPGDGALPYSDAEVTALAEQLPLPVLLRGPDGTPPRATDDVSLPTKDTVLRHLPDCAVVHFACHGTSDPADPSKSALLLHDHRVAPLTAADLGAAELGHAQLAYLSACETAATRNPALTDEAIHLASACQLAGFPHVIGTLWNVDDKVSVDVATSFYAHLTATDGALNTDRAAHALHAAVRPLRDLFPGTPSLWAAYLHTGA
jgi:CHAT domain-containing protein